MQRLQKQSADHSVWVVEAWRQMRLVKLIKAEAYTSIEILISNPDDEFSIIISAVGDGSSVGVQRQGQRADFWNVPCELHSM